MGRGPGRCARRRPARGPGARPVRAGRGRRQRRARRRRGGSRGHCAAPVADISPSDRSEGWIVVRAIAPRSRGASRAWPSSRSVAPRRQMSAGAHGQCSSADIGPASRGRRYAGALRTDARSRSNGTVATAIPPITRTTPRSWSTVGASWSRTIAEHDRHHGLGEQDDRGQHRRQPRERQRDQQVAERLRRQPEQREPGEARRGRGRVQVADDDAGEGRDERRRDRRDRDRPGRPPQVAAAAPDDEQVAGVAQRGREPERHAEPGVRCRTPGRRSRRRSGPPRRARPAGRGTCSRDGRSPNASHATTPTIRTWRLPRTVASPAPTYSIAWCQNRRSPAKKTPANRAIRTVRPGNPPKRRCSR